MLLTSLLYFFFLMIRHPPRSTLFPYTPLSRPRAGAAKSRPPRGRARECRSSRTPPARRPTPRARRRAGRSEEHTSELQSRQYLVCRLLLEKKKNNIHNYSINLHVCTIYLRILI